MKSKKIIGWPRLMPTPVGILWSEEGESGKYFTFRAYQIGKLRIHIPTVLGIRFLIDTVRRER